MLFRSLCVRLYGHSGVGIGAFVEVGVPGPARHGEGLAVACKGREFADIVVILPVGIGKEVTRRPDADRTYSRMRL